MRSFVLGLLATAAFAACTPDAAPPPRAPDAPPPTTAAPASTPAPTTQAQATPAAIAVPKELQAVVDASDRADADKALDKGRHPAETLAFFGIKPGMRVAEIAAGGGYTAELLARAVGPSGAVFGVNSKFLLDRFAEKPWSERLAKPVMKNVTRLDRDFDDPLPAEVHDLDAVFCVLFYHDTVWMKTDRAKMNAAVYKALKPGGVFAIIDHAARAGAGTNDVESLHRIEEGVVRAEVEKAGFKLAGTASFLANPADTRDWNDSPRAAGDKRGTSDRFVLKFVK